MLSKFTWTDYLSAVALLVIIYYVIITALYYRTEIKNILSGKFEKKTKDISDSSAASDGMDEADFDELEAVVADLKRSTLQQAGTNTNKDQLLLQLKQRLANYDGLRRPAFRVAVNHYIIEHAKEICGVAFSEDELDGAWKTLPR